MIVMFVALLEELPATIIFCTWRQLSASQFPTYTPQPTQEADMDDDDASKLYLVD